MYVCIYVHTVCVCVCARLYVRMQARSQGGSVGLQKVKTTIITIPYRDVGIGPAGSAAAKLWFHSQFSKKSCDQLSKQEI